MSLASLPALAVATLIPFGYLYWVSKRDFFETRKIHLIRICFVWGLAAYALAYLIQSNLYSSGILTRDQLVRVSAPILEEILKGAILIYLIRRADFTYFVDGAIYGFTVGIGFAIIENFEYIISNPTAAVTLALMRVLSTNLIHATASGSIGIALGLSRFERAGSARRLLSVLASALVAMGLHMAFNNLVSNRAPILLAILVGCGGGVLIYVIMRRGLAIMKTWVDEELLEESSITSREASIVNQFEDVDKILEPFAARFGAQKAGLAREILLAQAQIGIYRRTVEKHQDEKLRRAAETQVADLRQKMNENRKLIGAYCMLFLRIILPEDVSPFWGRLETIIQERGAATKDQAGTGLWTTLNQRAGKASLKEKEAE